MRQQRIMSFACDTTTTPTQIQRVGFCQGQAMISYNPDKEVQCETMGNNIYIYDVVDTKLMMDFQKKLYQINTSIKKACFESNSYLGQQKFKPEDFKINVHICSPGGGLLNSVAMYHLIKNNDIPITTIGKGMIFSGASLIFLGGRQRHLQQGSMVLIHQLRSFIVGWNTYKDIKEMYKSNQKQMAVMMDIYLSEMNITKKQLQNIIFKEVALTVEEAQKFNFATKIV